ncbi:MAG: SDR family NAD(P)-dependent oxidoreductase [Gloeocapsa sp. DLM2.Bin57]|nr:MAG: SDR family NAD(P)-dependent oxidoreductase [Gloeocapsa sp. DLM2.Bin57]
MNKLEGKIALVTGATRGIGKGIAIGLGEAGATIYITGRSLNSDPEVGGNLQATSDAVTAAGGKCIPVAVDHSDDTAVETLFQRIAQEQNGQLDILVNNVYGGVKALRNNQGKPFWEGELNLWDACNKVGLRSHYIASYYAAKMMTPRKQGLICTISSWGGMSYIFGAAYGAGKAACDRLAADMAVELQPYNVTSISLWPGIVGTEHITQLAQEIKNQGDTTPQNSGISEGYNWETPLFTGRAIAALATEPNLIRYTGTTQIVAELARRYNILDVEGNQPVSLRSLRFLLPLTIPTLRDYAQFIPDIYIPWFLLLLIALKSPKIG